MIYPDLDDSSTVNINNTWILLPISHRSLISFCTQGLPGVAESTVSKSEGKLLPGEKVAVSGRMRAGEKGFFPEPYLASKKVASVPEDEGYSWNNGFCDFAFGSAQNDSIG